MLAAPALAAVRVEAYRGEPFGIGRVTIDLPQGGSAEPWSDDRFAIEEAGGRVLYPVIENKQTGRLLRGFLGIDSPFRVTFYFMFRGDEPLELIAHTPDAQQITVRPASDARDYRKLVDGWWKATTDRYQQVYRQAEYPVLVENYLTATWARRLGREMPRPAPKFIRPLGLGDPWLSQLMANEGYQADVERDLLLGRFGAGEQATIPLPGTPDLAAEPPANGAEVEALPTPQSPLPTGIEPIAAHVPQECFYLRFGNFTNYLWFRDFLRHWQGDLGNMLVMQSVNHKHSDRFQQQIAVGESKLARVMGPAVIKDVAIIGLDYYIRDGAAMGILFQANNNALLGRNLSEQRTKAMEGHEGAKEETIKIAGHDVSFTSSPDGKLRSFYAVDGDFHLIANSRRLIERFFEAGTGAGSLAASSGFQKTRTAMPLTRDDTIFVYVSAQFFENLSSPQYRVELDRRLRSIGEIRALKLAQLAAVVEGQEAASVDDLIAAELLPAGFGQRVDGSELIASSEPAGLPRRDEPGGSQSDKNGGSQTYFDSLRGMPGWMVPVADVPVTQITNSEARRYAEFQQELAGSVGKFSPIAIALKRGQSPTASDWDRITADVRIAPYSQMPIARWPNMLGPAAKVRVAPVAGDVVSLELIVDALGQPVHLFGGLRDFRPPLAVRAGEVQTQGPTSDFVRGYVGGWPQPHLLERFLGRPVGPLDKDGIVRTGGLFNVWLRRADDFFLFAFQRDVLLEVGQQLQIVDTDQPAQIRLKVDDLTGKQLATAVDAYGYGRARDASASGSRFMNSLTTQLHVPPAAAHAVAEDLVGGKFVCPLGGEYVLVDPLAATPVGGERAGEEPARQAEVLPGLGEAAPGELASSGGRVLWSSTAPPPENRFLLTVIPADYKMPLLDWFRGLSAEVGRTNDELTLHAELDMTHLEIAPPKDPDNEDSGILTGIGNLLGGFGKKRDENVKPASASDEEAPR